MPVIAPTRRPMPFSRSLMPSAPPPLCMYSWELDYSTPVTEARTKDVFTCLSTDFWCSMMILAYVLYCRHGKLVRKMNKWKSNILAMFLFKTICYTNLRKSFLSLSVKGRYEEGQVDGRTCEETIHAWYKLLEHVWLSMKTWLKF